MARESFQASLARLQDDLLRMGTLVEESIYKAVKSLNEQNQELAQEVIDGDDLIDQMELDIEQECLRLFALQQPLAQDLRVIGTVLKIVTDLERLADHAQALARITLRIGTAPLIKPLLDIQRMAIIVQSMVRDSLKAYIEHDVDAAHRMAERDGEVDQLYGQIVRELLLIMIERPQTINQGTQLMFAGMHLERMGDHATNVGEWTIYMVTGERKELN